MSNYIEYLKWRGDLSFQAAPFCEVDAMILCQLVYINMQQFVSSDFKFDEITAEQICQYYLLSVEPKNSMEKILYEISEAVLSAPRISKVRICGYEDIINTEEHQQFAAATFEIDEETSFVAYRGTDETLVGWKENMDLAYNEEVPSQKAAVEYLNRAAESLGGKIYVGGHSKGGNLAVYASAFSNDSVNEHLQAIYNFDGPGFNNIVIQKKEFLEVKDLVHTYVPQNSLIGLLLKHKESYTVIRSTKISGMNEHQMDTWEVGPKDIVRETELKGMGKVLNENIQEWIDSMTYEEKRQFIEVLYDLVDEYATVEDLSSPRNLARIAKSYSSMNEENKKKVSAAMGSLSDTVKANIKEYFQNLIN